MIDRLSHYVGYLFNFAIPGGREETCCRFIHVRPALRDGNLLHHWRVRLRFFCFFPCFVDLYMYECFMYMAL